MQLSGCETPGKTHISSYLSQERAKQEMQYEETDLDTLLINTCLLKVPLTARKQGNPKSCNGTVLQEN